MKLLPILALTGCFYVDPINQRPSIEIQNGSGDSVYRGQTITLTSTAQDPEGQAIVYNWRVYACTDASDQTSCDHDPLETSLVNDVTFTVPITRADILPSENAARDVTGVRVILQARDELGATAKPDQILVIPVTDDPPSLEVGKSFRPAYVVDVPVTLFVKYTDSDDLLTSLAVDWQVFSPLHDDTYDFVDTASGPVDQTHLQRAKKFTPHAPGPWDVQVTVTDPLGQATMDTIHVDVAADAPPCIAQYVPVAPLAAGSPPLPISDPTRFAVPVVSDDLDPYPSNPGDPVLGTAAFSWSIQAPGATAFTPLGVSGNSVELDPAAYAIGDQLELRVDIADRLARPLSCPASDLTCAVVSGSSCIQRLTWRVEVR